MFGVIQTNNETFIKKQRYVRIVGTISAFILLLLTFFAAFPPVDSTNDAEALTSTPASTILTMTSASTSANLDLVVANANGTFSSSSASEMAQFSVATNNYTGYKLFVSSTNDTKQLTNSTSGTALESVAYATDAGLFGGDTATSLNNKWGYKPSKYNSVANTDFLPAPTTSASTLDETNSANSTANNYTIALGARADYSTIPGTYTNTFVLTAVANNISSTVNFNDNTNDSTVANLPASISSNTTSTSVALPTTIPTRTGYTFAGWCDTVTTVNANGTTTCNSTVYPASTTTTTSYLDFIDQTASSNIANLYAMWDINSYNVTVNFAGSGVSSVAFTASGQTSRSVTASGGTASLVYNVPYTMTMNFADGYEFESWALNSSSYGTLSSTSTNPATFIIKASNSAIITATGKKIITMQDVTYNQCTATGLTATDVRDSNTYTIKRLGDGNCWMTQNLRFKGTNLNPTTTNVSSARTITYSSKFSSLDDAIIRDSGNTTNGVWYNYAAATAMSIIGNENRTEATESICPKGWRLPVRAELDGITSYSSSFAPVAGGMYDINGALVNTSKGYWWSSTTGYGSYYRFNLEYDGNSLSVNGTDARYEGYYVRCIKSTMQNISSTEIAAMNNGDTTTRPDARDEQEYTIAKINGQLWMTRNLNLAGNTTLNSSTSNVTSSYTLPASSTSGFSDDSTAYVYNSGSTSCGDNSPCYSYYSYAAATAGTNPSSGDATSDICPKGWRLPTRAEFSTLISSYSTGSALTGLPFLAVYGGLYYNSSFSYGGSIGRYLSSTVCNLSDACYLDLHSSNADVYGGIKRSGYSVRCVKS